MNRNWLYGCVVAAVAALPLFVNLGEPRLWDRDEPRNAGCAAEMRERGDWIVPTFNGELRAHKPALLYWFMLASYAALGQSEFAARLPSALLGVGTTLLTLAIGRRLFSPRAGMWAGIVLATCISFDVAARAATPDSALIFTVTAALAAYVYFAFPRRGDSTGRLVSLDSSAIQLRAAPRRRYGWLSVYAILGLAALAKGPVGVALPVAILGMFLLIANAPATDGSVRGRWHWLARFHPEQFLAVGCRMRPLLLVIAVLAVAAPWYVAVHLQTGGAFTDEFFFKHNVERATSAMEGHRGPIVYYVVAMLVGFFPWSIFAAPVAIETVRLLRRGDATTLGIAFALCWGGVWIGAFSLLGTKLPNYIAPAYPALALLTGLYIDRWLAGESTTAARWMPWALGTLAVVGVGLAIGLPLASRHYFPGDEIIGLVGAIPIAAAIAAFWWHRRQQTTYAAASLALGAVAFCVAAFGFAQVRLDKRQVSEDLLAEINAQSPYEAKLAAFRDLEPSFVYYAGRTIPTINEELAAGEFFRKHVAAYMVLDGSSLDALRPKLPADVDVVARRPKFLKPGEVVVLGRTPRTIARLTRDGPYLADQPRETSRQ